MQGHTAGGTTLRRGPSCGSILGAGELELSCQGGVESIHSSSPWANKGKRITANRQWDLEADTLPTCVCGPGGATDRALCACASPSPAPFSLLCRAARHGKERQKNAQTKITQGFICKANGAGGSGFPQAAKKGCIESPGWAEHRRHSSLSSSVALLQTQMGSGSSTTGQREQRESVLGAVQRAAHAARTGPVLDRFVWGLQTSGPISGQTIPFPHHCPKIFWCLIMGCACYGAFYYWWYLFNLFSIFTKHLLFQPQLGLASKFNSYEDKGQVSCMGTIS